MKSKSIVLGALEVQATCLRHMHTPIPKNPEPQQIGHLLYYFPRKGCLPSWKRLFFWWKHWHTGNRLHRTSHGLLIRRQPDVSLLGTHSAWFSLGAWVLRRGARQFEGKPENVNASVRDSPRGAPQMKSHL